MPPKSNNDDLVTATHVLGSSRCCCYSKTMISHFAGGTTCAAYNCTAAATHGAHVTIGQGSTVHIIGTCQTHNPPAANFTFRITKAAATATIPIECCCFDNGRLRQCRCARGNPICGCIPCENPPPVCHCTSRARQN